MTSHILFEPTNKSFGLLVSEEKIIEPFSLSKQNCHMSAMFFLSPDRDSKLFFKVKGPGPFSLKS
jgi:hypothetical protein